MAGKKGFTFRPRGRESIELYRAGRLEPSIDLVYWHPLALRRHRNAPLLKEREEFLLHLLRQGTSRAAVQRAASVLLRAINVLRLRRIRNLGIADIRDASVKIWGREFSSSADFSEHFGAYHLRGTMNAFLRFHDKLNSPKTPQPFKRHLAKFREFMRSTPVSDGTLESHHYKSATFLRWFSSRNKALARVCVGDVDRFLAMKRKAGCSSGTLSSLAHDIRTFFRYAESQGWCSRFAEGIKAPYYSSRKVQPQGRTWLEVKQLLETTDGKNLAELRAKAALSLISTYALRSSEVARLLISDFDWKKGTLTLRRSKRGRKQRQPIEPEVKSAVLNYMKARPRCTCRNLFVSLRPRYRSIGKRSFYDLTSLRLKRLGITSGRFGPHAIRHARVMHLLREGKSVKEIGDFLGQRHPESPLFYAKFDVELLREVADFKLDGLL